jgi:hypothetical protein
LRRQTLNPAIAWQNPQSFPSLLVARELRAGFVKCETFSHAGHSPELEKPEPAPALKSPSQATPGAFDYDKTQDPESKAGLSPIGRFPSE